MMRSVGVFQVVRVSLLWDERWVALLSYLGPALQSRLRGLAREAHSLGRNDTLGAVREELLPCLAARGLSGYIGVWVGIYRG
jgi:hypothetical protein